MDKGKEEQPDEEKPPNFQELEVAMFTTNLKNRNTNWYLDSGATSHVIGDASKFVDLKEIVDRKIVKFVAGHKHMVYGKGSIVISQNGAIKKVNNVLYVPGVKKNWLFVGAIADMRYMVLFGTSKCWILSNKYPHKLIADGWRDPLNGLYMLTMEVIPRTVTGKTETLLLIEGES